MAVLHRHVVSTMLNRRIVASWFGVIGGISLSRALGVAAGVPSPQLLLTDCLILGIGSIVCATYAFRWYAWASVFMLLAAAGAALDPPHAMLAFSLGTGLALPVCAYCAWRAGTIG
jgi:hypothetical protein